MSISRKNSRRQAVSATCPPHGTTAASTPPLPVPCTISLTFKDLTWHDVDALMAHCANERDVTTAWTPQTSAVCDWLLCLEENLHTLETTMRHLRRAIEETAL